MQNIQTFDSTTTSSLTNDSLALNQEIKGHPFILTTLQRAFEQNRLHHAYLFHGPSGVGKKRVALVFARLLLCTSSTTSNNHACGICKSCTRLTAYINGQDHAYHPDLHHISREVDKNGKKAKEIKIAPIRDLQSSLSLGSFEGGRSIVIIEEVDRLGLAAANALLKTLEEPLANVHFLLTTSSLNAVLPTIKSRAQSLRFPALSLTVLEQLLIEFEQSFVQSSSVTEENVYHPLSELQRQSLAQLSGGSIGRALSLWSQGGMHKVEHLIQKSDLSGGAQDFLNALDFAKSLDGSPESDIALWIHLLRCWYRDALLLLHTTQQPDLFFPSYQELIDKRGHTLGVNRLIWRLQALDEGEKHLLKRTGSNRKLILEALCLYLAGFDALTQKPLNLS